MLQVAKQIGQLSRRLDEAILSTGAIVLLPSDVLCDQARCVTRFDGISLYRDVGHVTQLGSRLLVKRLGLKAILNPQSVPR